MDGVKPSKPHHLIARHPDLALMRRSPSKAAKAKLLDPSSHAQSTVTLSLPYPTLSSHSSNANSLNISKLFFLQSRPPHLPDIEVPRWGLEMHIIPSRRCRHGSTAHGPDAETCFYPSALIRRFLGVCIEPRLRGFDRLNYLREPPGCRQDHARPTSLHPVRPTIKFRRATWDP